MHSKPTMPRGRPAKYVKGKDGKPITGLSLSSQGRYYATHSRPRKAFGRDFDQALIRFRQWQAEQNGEPLAAVKVNMPPRVKLPEKLETEHILEQLNSGRAPREVLEELAGTYDLLPPDALYAWARTEILEDPSRFAERVGIPQIADLQNLKPQPPSPTLASLIRIYKEKAKVAPHERQKSERYWKEFRRLIKGRCVRDVTQDAVAAYHDWVMNAGYSQTWIKHRFGKIKTVFRFAQTRGIASAEIDTVLAFCKILVPPRSSPADPHPISREDFNALVQVADKKWQAILLCLLNFCMYGKEVGDLDTRDVDLKKSSLVTDRNKTGVTRVATLWDRTVQAIKAAPQHPANPSLFVNNAGARLNPDDVRRGFTRLRTAAGLPDSVKVSDIRDGAYTAAVEAGADLSLAMLLAGHRTGIADYYVRRNPKMVADACKAIEAHYFGKRKAKAKQKKAARKKKTAKAKRAQRKKE